ncbi:polysaccharide deacetylase [Mycobacterium dioxanotrophicus]|uniref:Polysaccharide deacetylase n=1 Tax=Mycobacterium dioxanotrophicus TaxID=482462 RepID=A0A1Y0CD42_9MYCO|nr:polysaccharide deacetylase family protein [Mycobacterium dioxanotrophicus]ART72926.1 polysaccharide deacetylase [Mycobacterium dioxanotrophicus]
MTGQASLSNVQVAITVDDFVLWDGTPLPEGHSSLDVTRALAEALTGAGQHGIYGFAHTYSIAKDPASLACWNAWLEAGHHLGNHTHQHAPLRWMSADDFCRDVDQAEKLIGPLVDQAPERYFRYPMDMCSGSESKRGQVEDFLRDNGYRNAPITCWFGDFVYIVPYQRSLITGDVDAQARLEDLHVQGAIEGLETHAASARAMFGTDVPHIWMVHGTPLAARTIGRIIEAYKQRGVQFVSLEKAMQHPVNFSMPPVQDSFSNHLQRYAMAAGIAKPDLSDELFGEILVKCPINGMDTLQFYDEKVLKPIADQVGSPYLWDWS